MITLSLPKANLTKPFKSWTIQLIWCDHSNESSWWVLYGGGVHNVAEQSSCYCLLAIFVFNFDSERVTTPHCFLPGMPWDKELLLQNWVPENTGSCHLETEESTHSKGNQSQSSTGYGSEKEEVGFKCKTECITNKILQLSTAMEDCL